MQDFNPEEVFSLLQVVYGSEQGSAEASSFLDLACLVSTFYPYISSERATGHLCTTPPCHGYRCVSSARQGGRWQSTVPVQVARVVLGMGKAWSGRPEPVALGAAELNLRQHFANSEGTIADVLAGRLAIHSYTRLSHWLSGVLLHSQGCSQNTISIVTCQSGRQPTRNRPTLHHSVFDLPQNNATVIHSSSHNLLRVEKKHGRPV